MTIMRTEIIQKLSEKLRAYYVFPDIAEQVCERLQKCLDDGECVAIAKGELLASALTEHLQSVNHDEHLRVRRYSEPLPEHDGLMLQNQERLVEFRQRDQLDNYGFHRVERLLGNVGYVDIRYFYRPSWGSGDTAVVTPNGAVHIETR